MSNDYVNPQINKILQSKRQTVPQKHSQLAAIYNDLVKSDQIKLRGEVEGFTAYLASEEKKGRVFGSRAPSTSGSRLTTSHSGLGAVLEPSLVASTNEEAEQRETSRNEEEEADFQSRIDKLTNPAEKRVIDVLFQAYKMEKDEARRNELGYEVDQLISNAQTEFERKEQIDSNVKSVIMSQEEIQDYTDLIIEVPDQYSEEVKESILGKIRNVTGSSLTSKRLKYILLKFFKKSGAVSNAESSAKIHWKEAGNPVGIDYHGIETAIRSVGNNCTIRGFAKSLSLDFRTEIEADQRKLDLAGESANFSDPTLHFPGATLFKKLVSLRGTGSRNYFLTDVIHPDILPPAMRNELDNYARSSRQGRFR